MNNENNKPTVRRRAAAQIIGTLGGGLMVATVVRLFQVAQEILPWWWPYPLIIGSVLFLIALLLLVPDEWWKAIGKIWHFRTEIREKRLKKRQRIEEQKRRIEIDKQWQINRPEYTISEPNINPQPINPKEYHPQYNGNFKISIKNRCPSQPPLEVYFNSAGMKLERKFGRTTLSMSFLIQPNLPNSSIQPGGQQEYVINMLGWPDGTAQPYLNLGQTYHWVISGISLDLYGLGKEDCRREGDINV